MICPDRLRYGKFCARKVEDESIDCLSQVLPFYPPYDVDTSN